MLTSFPIPRATKHNLAPYTEMHKQSMSISGILLNGKIIARAFLDTHLMLFLFHVDCICSNNTGTEETFTCKLMVMEASVISVMQENV